MDGSLVIVKGSLLSKFKLFHWMEALSLWKVVCCRDIFYSNGWYPCHNGRESVVEIFVTQWMVALSLWKVVCCRDFVTPMDGRLVIMEGSLLSRFLLLQWMVALLLWNVVYCRDFCYSIGW